MKKFKKQTFINAAVLSGLLLSPSFLAAWEEDDGAPIKNLIWATFAKFFYVLRFPTHT